MHLSTLESLVSSVQFYATKKKNGLYEQLHTFQERLPEGVVVTGDLNVKMGSNNKLLNHVMGSVVLVNITTTAIDVSFSHLSTPCHK